MLEKMRKIIAAVSLLGFIFVLSKISIPTHVLAAPDDCNLYINNTLYKGQKIPTGVNNSIKLNFEFDFFPVVGDFESKNFKFSFPGTIHCKPITPCTATVVDTKASYLTNSEDITGVGDHTVELIHESGGKACNPVIYHVGPPTCSITIDPGGQLNIRSDITLHINNMFTKKFGSMLKVLTLTGPIHKSEIISPGPDAKYDWHIGTLSAAGIYTLNVTYPGLPEIEICKRSFCVARLNGTGCGVGPPLPPELPTTDCDQCGWCPPKDPPDYWDKCNKCITGETLKENSTLKPGAWTALGCISTEPSGFISWLLQKVIGVAGGIAFLLILFGGFQILTSTGDPEKLTSGKDIIVSALAGLLMIVFSVLLLRIIGVDILQIPGLGG
jgi:hypothetical protein